MEEKFKNKSSLATLNRISINTIESTEFIYIEDIMYCKSDNSYTTIYLKTGESLIASKSIKHIQDILPETFFKRSHNSYIVNKIYVKRYLKKDRSLELISGIQLPLSKSKREKVLVWLKCNKYFF